MLRRSVTALVAALVVVSVVATGAVGATSTTQEAQPQQMQTQESEASVSFSNQTSGGYTVTVDSVTLPEGGFVTVHDASLTEGETLASVVGSSTYLSAGTHEDVTVRLSEPLSETGTLVAMPHMDDGDRVYEFVSGNAESDGPYTAGGEVVVDDASVTVSATVSASDQPTDGTSVVVDRVELSRPGFVVVHDETLLDEGDAVGSVVGHSGLLSAGVHENVRVELDSAVDSETVVPMAHVDSNGNAMYEFPDADGPFTDAAGDAVVDTADVTVSDTSTVSFAAQSTGGTRVVVDEAYLPEGGFVVLHDSALAEGEAVESVRGASDYLAPGLHRNVVVDLSEPLDAGTTERLTAMTHMDTNGNAAYEFPDADGPYTADGGAVVDGADVTVSASVTYDVTESDGNTVTVDSVDLSEGGFVVVHDPSLFAGAVEGSVLGSSAYLEPGVHENVTVTLSTPANESQVLVPMAHRDTNGNEAYEFPDSDGPYTYDGGAVVASAKTIVPAQVSFSGQESTGETVTVDSVTLSDGGFVTVHDSTLLDGDALGSVRGTSAYLSPGTHTDVEVTLDEPLAEDDTLVAMPHRDTDGNEAYSFVESEGSADGPYVAAGGAVVASAEVTYTGSTSDDGSDMTETETEMSDDGSDMTETETEMSDDGSDMTETETEMSDDMTETETSGGESMDGETQSADDATGEQTPGFGVVVAVVALLAAALVAARRND